MCVCVCVCVCVQVNFVYLASWQCDCDDCFRFYARNTKGLLVNAPYVDCSYKYAGGGMLSTVTDLIHFANAMLYSYQYQSLQSNDTMQQQKGNLSCDAAVTAS